MEKYRIAVGIPTLKDCSLEAIACSELIIGDGAIISLPNGEVVDGKVQSWTDYEDGDQIQVKIGGVTYLVHSSQAALITGKEGA